MTTSRETVVTDHNGHTIDLESLSQRIGQVFDRFDKDASGSLDRHELHSVFRTLGPNFTPKQIQTFCKRLDQSHDGQVDRAEFLKWIIAGSGDAKDVLEVIIKATGDALAASLREVFSRFDADGGGSLEMREMARVLRILEPKLTMSEVDGLCKELDNSGDGSVSMKEFLLWLKSGTPGANHITRSIVANTGAAREQRIRQAYEKYDATGDGLLDIEEVSRTLKALGSFTNDEVRKVCADLDRSGDGQVDFEEFLSWMKRGRSEKEVVKAKAIMAPSDGDGLEAVFYNFCGPGKADMDGKSFKKVCQDCDLIDKKFDVTAVDLIFSDKRIKDKSQRVIDFFQFENALELIASKKGIPLAEVRNPVLLQGGPKLSGTRTMGFSFSNDERPANQTVVRKPKRTPSQKRIAAILRMTEHEIPGKESWRKDTDNRELWKIFGLNTAAGRALKRVYTPPYVPPPPSRCSTKDSRRSRRAKSKDEGWSSPYLTLMKSFSESTLRADAPGPNLSDFMTPTAPRQAW
eukprot:TRINITY_DN28461_c2_g1_i1.p1 TRINITY_DN28461_c2_g1~~TRINITY_DN28461_c2_g1_i1.p1  ORF type:complete len:519 (-),score=101.28 TRINITY_DN28461_c2_g1_i1:143-1699(-)